MAAVNQRLGKRGKQPIHAGYSGHRMGGVKDHYTQQHPMASSMSPASLPGVYSNPDMAYALVGIVGCVVDVQLQSGVAYQGVLKAVSPQLSVALALAHDKSKNASRENTERLLQLEFADIVTVSALSESNPTLNTKEIFKTDAEISRSNGPGSSRELQPFNFDDDSATLTLNDGSSGWSAEDMFQTNKSKFKVESSFDEEMTEYTTKLDRSDTEDFRQREERAAKLAREIEADPGGHGVDDTGTEEELFSSVVRQDVAPPPSLFKPISSNKHTRPLSQPTVSDTADQHLLDNNTSDLRLSAPSRTGTNSLAGTNSLSSLTDGSLSQDYHSAVDMDNVVGTKDSNGVGDGGGGGGGGGSGTASQESQHSHTEGQEYGKNLAETGLESGGDEFTEKNETACPKEVVEVTSGEITTPDKGKGGEPGTGERTEGAVVPPAMETTATTQSTIPPAEDKEKTIRKFRLDPNAKEFNPNAKEFVPSVSLSSSLNAQSSSSTAVSDSSSYSFRPPLATSHVSMTGKRYPKRVHPHTTPTPQYSSQDPVNYVSTSGNYLFTQAQQAAIVRSSGQMVQYPPPFVQAYPAAAGGYVNQQPPTVPHHVMSGGQKYVGADQHQMFAGGQQFPMHPHQLVQATPHSQIIPSVSQSQLSTGLVTSPATMLMQQQGGLSQPQPPGVTYPHMQVMPQTGQNQGELDFRPVGSEEHAYYIYDGSDQIYSITPMTAELMSQQ